MNAKSQTLKIGTRESKLALMQTEMVLALCGKRFPEQPFETVGLSTSGDKVLNKPIAELGGTGVFVKELEEALLADEVDFVVHSLKDLPTAVPDGLCLAAVLLREDPRDVFVSRDGTTFMNLPKGARVATSSRRRAAQLTALRNDLQFVDVRGNVPTRLRKLEENHCDGMILAAAGLKRLGFADRITHYFEPDQSVPAAGQGALALECRANDTRVKELLAQLNNQVIWDECSAERAFLARLGGGCSVPIGVLARCINDTELELIACVADGGNMVRGSVRGSREAAQRLGVDLAEDMLRRGADKILQTLFKIPPQPISPP